LLQRTIGGKEEYMRKGILIRPVKKRSEHDIGRVILKSASAEYFWRGDEATEFE